MQTKTTTDKRATANKVLPKAGLNGFDWTFVQGSAFLLPLNICAKKPRLRQYPKRYLQVAQKMRIITTFFILFPILNIFSQNKTIQNFENAINAGYINSPTLIPITVINNNQKKYFLSNTESLYYAIEVEKNQTNSDSLKQIILKNKLNQTFEFSNPEALEIIGFNKRKNVNSKDIKRTNNYINRKKILTGLKKLQIQKKLNSEYYDSYYKQRLIVRDKLVNTKEFNNNEIKLFDYLATNITTDESKISELGMWAAFENSNKIFEIWNQKIAIHKNKYADSKKIEKELSEKFVLKPHKKIGSNYFIALFKYGINFYVSDLDGTTHFRGIIK